MGAASAGAATASKTVELALKGKHRDVRGQLFATGLLLMLLLSLALLVVLVVAVLVDAWPTLSSRGVGFLTSNVSSFPDKAGVRQGIIGSIILIVFVALLAVPIGVAAAIYLQEYARDTRANRLLITNIRNLAGVPAIVYGILGVVIFVQAMQSITGPKVHGRSIIAGGLTLSVLVMPFVIIITMEALRAVPNGIRDAAYGVGATRWEVVRSHVLPYAAPGVFTGVILAIARAFGETAPLLLGGGGHRVPRDGTAERPGDPPREVHGAADDHLLLVEAAVEPVGGQHGRRDRGAARLHPGRELPGHHPEEPV